MALFTKQILGRVKSEAKKLKKFATPAELNRLDFKTLSPNSPHSCIYGQMAGDCWSDRAFELISKCVTRFSAHSLSKYALFGKEVVFVPNKGIRSSGERSYKGVFTALEWYIAQSGANNEELIAYLKGEKDTLEL